MDRTVDFVAGHFASTAHDQILGKILRNVVAKIMAMTIFVLR
jgi:hypothetical protein